VALPATVVSLGMLLASTFVLYRHASAFSNLLEYPIWLATGLLGSSTSRSARSRSGTSSGSPAAGPPCR
jgi:hypothetical protein